MEGCLNSFDSTKLFYRLLKPDKSPKAVVIVVHGFGDHSGGMQNISTYLVENDYMVISFDLRGHGKSSGKRGYVENWDEYTADLAQIHRLVVSDYPELPIYLVGHSMGGVLALDYVLGQEDRINGVVTFSPAISYKASPLEKFGVMVMGKLKPDFRYTKRGNFQMYRKNLAKYGEDNINGLRHNIATPGLGRALLHAISRVGKQADFVKVPFLLQYGLDDKIIPPTKLNDFFAKVGSKNKDVFAYPVTKHRPFDESLKEQVLTDLINWFNQQIEQLKNKDCNIVRE